MRIARISIALLCGPALAACTGDDPGPLPSPTSAFRPTGATGLTAATGPSEASGASGPTATLPTSSPGAATGNLSEGTLSFQISGDVEAERSLANLIAALYTPPPGAVAIVWNAGGTDATTVGLGGASFVGTMPTSPSLSISISVQSASGLSSFQSIDGECDVTIDRADEDELSGSFTCDDLRSAIGEVVDVSASFAATG